MAPRELPLSKQASNLPARITLLYSTCEAPQVYVNPNLCKGVILLGRCFGCPWDGPVTSGSGGFRPPIELRIESGDFVCGCDDTWRPSSSKPNCEITRLTEDELSTVGCCFAESPPRLSTTISHRLSLSVRSRSNHGITACFDRGLRLLRPRVLRMRGQREGNPAAA